MKRLSNKKIIIFALVFLVLIIITSLFFINYQTNNSYLDKSEILSEKNIMNHVLENDEVVSNTDNLSDNSVVENIEVIEENSIPEIVAKEIEQEKVEVKKETPKVETTTQVQTAKQPAPKVETQQVVKQEETPKKSEEIIEAPKVTEPEAKKEEPKPQVPDCSNGHGVSCGNSGKWFNSKQEAINYNDSIQKTWGAKWENFEIDDDTYDKNCPYRYEVWSCPFCGKWTINFYYRK